MVDTLTQIADLVNPEVNAPIVQYELEKALRFTPLAQVDNTLVGQPGDTVKMPKYTYIGDAKDIAEGAAIPLDKLGTTTASVKVKKAGKGTQITDEAGKQKVTDIEITVDGLETALAVFPDDSDDSQVVFVVNKKNAMKLRRDAQKQMAGSDVGANAVIANTRYAVEGVQIV